MQETINDPGLANEQQPQQKKQTKMRQLIARMGLGAFTISLLVHIVFAIIAIFLLYKWVYPPEEKVDFLPGGGGGGGSNGDQVHKVQQQKRMMSSTSMSKRIASTSTTATFTLPESSNEMMDPGLPMANSMAELGSGGGSGGGHGTGVGTGTGSGTGPGKGFGAGQLGIGAVIPSIMKGRCTDSERLKMIAEAGGSPKVEEAVKKSLKWLKTQQNPDGSWGKNRETAMTGLVLLCYLGHCEGTTSAEYGDNVSKGITYLINMGMKNKGKLTDARDHSWVYEHAIGTYALAEALTFSRTLQFKTPELEPAVEKAVDLILTGQNKDGCWDYDYALSSNRNDLSVGGWQMQALKAAKASGVKMNDYDGVIRKAMDYIAKDAYLGNGRFAYGKTPKPAMTAVGVLCLQQHDRGDTGPARDGIKLIMDGLQIRDKKNAKDDFSEIYSMQYNNASFDMYGSYYAAQVMRNAGGREWDAMNKAIVDDIVPAQKEDGSFKFEAASSGVGTSAAGGSREIYCQALNTLMLEVYYRFLPTSAGHGRARSSFDEFR